MTSDDPKLPVWTASLGDGRVAVLQIPDADDDFGELSPSERSVAGRLLAGETYQEIADARGRSKKTIANQARRIYQKLGVSSRSELVRLAAARAANNGPRVQER